MKKILVLFSAGIDSTYLVWTNLKKGYHVTPIYIYIKNNIPKSEIEYDLAKILIKRFQKDFPNQVDDLKLGGKVYMNLSTNYAPSINQVPLWIMSILYNQDTKYHHEIHLGYTSHDVNVVPYIEDIKSIYYSYTAISKKLLELKFPILDMTKNDIVNQLPDKYLEKTVSCEYPKIEHNKLIHCLKCEPCKKNIELNNNRINKKFYINK